MRSQIRSVSLGAVCLHQVLIYCTCVHMVHMLIRFDQMLHGNMHAMQLTDASLLWENAAEMKFSWLNFILSSPQSPLRNP